MKEVALRVVKGGVDILVQVPVSLPQLLVEVRRSLAGELAVEDEDVPPLLLVVAGLRCGGERLHGHDGGQELLVLAVLPVLCAEDVASLVLELVSYINNPRIDICLILMNKFEGKADESKPE